MSVSDLFVSYFRPFGQMMKPMLDSMNVNPGDGTNPIFGESTTPSHRVVVPSQQATVSSTADPQAVPEILQSTEVLLHYC